ncbi:MAG: hypothetical protein IJU71_04565, partial [Selenomonadaceae bacterium]|nr:hypothetical protein [Selenomonadaceae bacterium]
TIPTVDEFWHLIEDETFPLYRKIKEKRKWCTQSGCMDVAQGVDAISGDDAVVLPCSHSLFSRTPKSTLEIFIDNLLDPLFNDARISELYRSLYKPPKYHFVKNPSAPPIEGFETSDLLKYIAHLEARTVMSAT